MCPRGICAVIKYLSSLDEVKYRTQIGDSGLQMAAEPRDICHKCSSGAKYDAADLKSLQILEESCERNGPVFGV